MVISLDNVTLALRQLLYRRLAAHGSTHPIPAVSYMHINKVSDHKLLNHRDDDAINHHDDDDDDAITSQ